MKSSIILLLHDFLKYRIRNVHVLSKFEFLLCKSLLAMHIAYPMYHKPIDPTHTSNLQFEIYIVFLLLFIYNMLYLYMYEIIAQIFTLHCMCINPRPN